MNLFERITKGKDDYLLYEEGVLTSEGRLSDSGSRLVVDLLFQGKEVSEIRSMLLKEIKLSNKGKDV